MAAVAEQESAAARLKITEIFFSIQGEAVFSGWPTVFVRLTGCPLRCQYCDTAYAFTGGEWRTFAEIETEVRTLRHAVRLRDGRRAARAAALHRVAHGSSATRDSTSRSRRAAPSTLPASTRASRASSTSRRRARTRSHRNRWQNLELLTPHDAVKIVICDRADYEWARDVVAKHALPCPVFFSPSYEQLPAGTLADWILADRLPVRLQVQLHKVLWGNVPGR